MLFFSAADEKKCSDPALKALCVGKENCRRQTLLQSLGSEEHPTTVREACCDICHPKCPYDTLAMPCTPTSIRQRPKAIRVLSQGLKRKLQQRLLQERDAVISNRLALQMLPKSVVCPVKVIEEVCTRSKYISNLKDIRSIPCLRSELHASFLNTILEVVSNAPPVKRRRPRRQ